MGTLIYFWNFIEIRNDFDLFLHIELTFYISDHKSPCSKRLEAL